MTVVTTAEAREPDDILPALRQTFGRPPAEYRVALPGPQGTEYADEGISGGFLLSGAMHSPTRQGNVDPAWMDNPKLYERLREQIRSFKAKGVQLWYYDELAYPSGCAGGKVISGHPEFAAQILRCRRLDLTDENRAIRPEGKLIHAAAFPLRNAVIDLTEKVDLSMSAGGVLQWEPPGPGEWRVCLFEQVPAEAWKHHDQARQMGNIMDRKAMTRFIEITHGRLREELGDQVSDIFLFFTDEPQLNCAEYWGRHGRQDVPPAVQWTDELPEAFERQAGYPLAEALPALFNDVGPATGRYRYDFYDVYSDLIAENYWGQIQDWCQRNGTLSSGHMLLEETMLYSVMFNGSMFKNWQRTDLPGVDLLVMPRYDTMPNAFGREGTAGKIAASIREFCGKAGVFTESFALCDRSGKKGAALLRATKGVAAWQFYQGITHMFTYSLQNSLTREEYAEFADFAARLAVLCRQGVPVSDVAVVAPEASVWAHYNPPDGGTFGRYWACNPDVKAIDTLFNETCFALSSHQRDFEVLTERLLADAHVSDTGLELGRQRFAFLVLPEMRMMSAASMEKVEAFAAAGGRVVFAGALPSMSPENGVDPAMKTRAEALIADHPENVLAVREPTLLGQMIDWMAARVPPVVQWEGPATIRVARQRGPGLDIVMIANPSASPVSGSLSCAFGGDVSVWNPEDGEILEVGTRTGGTAVPLVVPADSARFVVVTAGRDDG